MVTWCADVMHWNMEGKSKPQPLLLISNAKLCNKSLIKRFKLTSGVPYFWFHTTLKYFHFWYRLAPALNSIYCIGSHFRSSSKALLLSCCCLVQKLVKCFSTLWVYNSPRNSFTSLQCRPRGIPEALLSVTSSASVQPARSWASCSPRFPGVSFFWHAASKAFSLRLIFSLLASNAAAYFLTWYKVVLKWRLF